MLCGVTYGPEGNRQRCNLDAGHPPARNGYGHFHDGTRSVWDTLYAGCPPEALEDAKRQHAGKLEAERKCELLERRLYEERKKRKGLLKQIRELVKEERSESNKGRAGEPARQDAQDGQ
jgi:hypothetical protein